MRNEPSCPICKKTTLVEENDYPEFEGACIIYGIFFNCTFCGRFYLSNNYQNTPILSKEKTKISAYLAEKKIRKIIPLIIEETEEWDQSVKEKVVSFYKNKNYLTDFINVTQIINSFPKTIEERIDRILLNIKHVTNGKMGETHDINYRQVSNFLYFSIDNETEKFNEIDMILNFMVKKGYLVDKKNYMGGFLAQIDLEGWKRIEQLESGINTKETQAFVAMWFDESMSHIREKIKEAIESSKKYSAKIISEHHHNNQITDEIISQIKKSKFVVADLTGSRPNVYYEAGYAKALGLPVIFTCEKNIVDDKKIHFDLSVQNIIAWENEDDLYKRLVDRIGATIDKVETNN